MNRNHCPECDARLRSSSGRRPFRWLNQPFRWLNLAAAVVLAILVLLVAVQLHGSPPDGGEDPNLVVDEKVRGD